MKTRFKVDLIDLVQPTHRLGIPVEEAFETLRWMLKTGLPFKESGSFSKSPVTWMLGGDGDGVHPVKSVDDLRLRLHGAILGKTSSAHVAAWREKYGINAYGRVTVPVRLPDRDDKHALGLNGFDVEKSLKRMFKGSVGDEMAYYLNPYHLDCRFVHGVSVSVRPDGFVFVLTYGETLAEGHGSEWVATIARTRDGETFLETLARADAVFNGLVLGDVENPRFDVSDVKDAHNLATLDAQGFAAKLPLVPASGLRVA